MIYFLPLLIIFILLIALFKNLPAYEIFTKGAKNAVELCLSVLPFLVAIFLMVELIGTSGFSNFISSKTQPFWNFLGISKEVTELVLLKPFTGSGSIAQLYEIISLYGPNSYITYCACVIMGSSDTLFYITAVYFSTTKIKKLGPIIPISLISILAGNIVACFVCKYLI